MPTIIPDGMGPVALREEHPEVVAWVNSVRTFSRSIMVLSGAVLAGLAQLTERIVANSMPAGLAVSAVVASSIAIGLGFLVERIAFAQAMNRYFLVFGFKPKKVGRTWRLKHYITEPIEGRKNLVKLEPRTHVTTSGVAGTPRFFRWLLTIQAAVWMVAAVNYAIALSLLLNT